jgi:hypothetical protein
MLTATLPISAKNMTQMPILHKGIDKMWCAYTMKYYLVIKTNAIL